MKNLRQRGLVFQKASVQSGAAPTDFDTSLVPTNAWHIEKAKAYPSEMAPLMSEKIDRVRNFFLNEIAPTAFASSNGFADANEVLVSSFGEKSSIAPLYSVFESFLIKAVRVKMMLFLSEEFGLSEKESILFLSSIGENNGDDRIQAIMREMQSMANLHRTAESSKVRVQQLPENVSTRRRSGVRPDRASASRPSRRSGEFQEEERSRADKRLRQIRKSFS